MLLIVEMIGNIDFQIEFYDMKYLLDTNIVIEFLNNSLKNNAIQFLIPIIDNESIISIISKMELLGFNFQSIQ